MSKLASSWNWSDILAVILVAVVVVVAFRLPFAPSPIFRDAAVGEWVIEHGEFPNREPLHTFADPNKPFAKTHWLSQLIDGSVAKLSDRLNRDAPAVDRDRRAGEAIRYFHAVLLLGSLFIWLNVYRTNHRSGWAALLGMSLLLICSIVGIVETWSNPLESGRGPAFLQADAMQWSIFGLGLLIALLLDRQLSVGKFFAVIAVMIIWANLHFGFLAGFNVMLFLLLGRMLDIAMSTDGGGFRAVIRDRFVKRLALLILVCGGLVTITTPAFQNVWAQAFNVGRDGGLAALKMSQPVNFSETPWLGVAAMIPFGIALIGLSCGRRINWELLLPFLFFAIWGLIQSPYLVWWWFIAPWLLLSKFEQSTPKEIPNEEIEDFSNIDEPSDEPRYRYIVLSLMVVGAILIFALPSRPFSNGVPWREAAQWRETQQRNADEMPGQIFASHTCGDYLLWRGPRDVLGGSLPSSYDEEAWMDHSRIRDNGARRRDIMEHRNINIVVLESHQYHKLQERLKADPEWRIRTDTESGLLIAERFPPRK